MKISNLLPAFLTLLIASIFGASPALANFTIQPNIQEVKGIFIDDKSSFAWLNADSSVYQIELISENSDVAAALILSSPETFIAQNFSFEYRKKERGVVFRSTSDPILRVEYFNTSLNSKLYKTFRLSDMKTQGLDGGWTKATVPGYLNKGVQNGYFVNRIAVVAKAENVGVVQHTFANFELRHLARVTNSDDSRATGFTPIRLILDAIDSRKDPLTNQF